MIKVSVQLNETSQPIEYDSVVNVYQKGSLICIQLRDDIVHKYPIEHIFRIVQDYGYHGDRPKLFIGVKK